jgi:hypothetical protein
MEYATVVSIEVLSNSQETHRHITHTELAPLRGPLSRACTGTHLVSCGAGAAVKLN